MGNIPIDKAELLSTILEGILYGFSLLMFGATVWVLFYRRSTERVNRNMLAVACSLLLCSTVHLVVDIVRVTDGLIMDRDGPGGPIGFFSIVSHWTFVTKTYLYVFQTLIGDGVILYRCFVVWRSKLVMVVPALLWCATGVTGIASACAESLLTAENDVFCRILLAWIDAFYGAAFFTNTLTTSLLAYRIWYFDHRATSLSLHSHSLLRGTLRTIIDAGAIYFIALLALMICFSLRSNSQLVIQDMIVPIISITFYMVIIRVGLFNHLRENQETVSDLNVHREARERLPAGNTTSTEGVLNIAQPSPTNSIASVIDNGSCQAENEVKVNDSKEVV